MEMPDGKLQNLTHLNGSINEAKWTGKKNEKWVLLEAETT